MEEREEMKAADSMGRIHRSIVFSSVGKAGHSIKRSIV